jgi:N-acetyl-anhydromuramyl-L-alanine amidase AmpD
MPLHGSRNFTNLLAETLARVVHYGGDMRWWPLALFTCACAGSTPQGPVARSLESASAEAGVPADLVMAIAIEEGGVKLAPVRHVDADDNVPVAGALELRHGKLDTLALGAQLAHTTQDALEANTELGTRAGALVLAQLGREHGAGATLESWRGALEALSGMDDDQARLYADRVFELLRKGGEFTARAGETLHLAAHPELPVAATPEAVTSYATAPDYPGAIWFTTSCTNKCDVGRPLGNASVNKIVIHDTEGGWDGSVATLQNDSGKSVHYIVDADGSRVGQFRKETDTTWHAGNYYYNETSIGIEHVGVASDPSGYSDGLYDTSRDLVQSIRTRWNVPLDRKHIIGHYQVPDGTQIAEDSAPCTDTLDNCENSANYGGADNHRDPGYYWQWCQYMEHLGGSCTCNDAWSHWNCTSDLKEAVRCTNGQVEISQCDLGCTVEPIGTDDVCAQSQGSDYNGTATGSAVTDPGDGTDGKHGGGCNAGGNPAIWLISLLLLVKRRRVV